MVTMTSTGNLLNLRMHSGGPIVEVHGEWEPGVADALKEMIGQLVNAGHFEIVVNIQRAALEGLSALRSLAQTVQAVRSHCGHLDVVGTVEQIQELLQQQTEKLFRLACTEETAIGRIKRLPVITKGVGCTAHTV